MSSYVDHYSIRLPTYVFLLLLIITYASSAQSDSSQTQNQTQAHDEYYPYRNINASMMIIVVIFIVIFLLIALMTFFIRNCAAQEWSSNSILFHRHDSTRGARFWKLSHRGGLDTSLVESFPTFSSFSEIKDIRKVGAGNAVLECAICLNELDDVDGKILRLLPKCGHVFHRDCIDNWITSHNTCPVCRTDLSNKNTTTTTTTTTAAAAAAAAARGEHLVVMESRTDNIIHVGERETAENQISITISCSNVDVVHNNNNNNGNNTFPSEKENIRRSRSTGHLTSCKKVKRCVAFSSDDEGSSERDGDARARPPLTGLLPVYSKL